MTARAAQANQLQLRREPRFARLVLTLLILAALTLVVMWLMGTFGRRRPLFVPLPLRSVLAADYSADPFADKLAGLGPELVEDILRDEAPTGAPERLATVVSELQTPVPTVPAGLTPTPSQTPPPSATLPAVLPSATSTQATPTASVTAEASATASETAPGPTSTTGATATLFVPPTATRTLVPPTFTIPPPTFTPVPPTFTVAPPTVPPTFTAVPATSTSEPYPQPTNPPPAATNTPDGGYPP